MGYVKARPGWRSANSNEYGSVVNNLTVGQYAHGGLVLGSGTSSSYKTTSTASKNFVSFYFGSSATSGDARAIYNQLYITGTGGGGESLRSFTTVNNVAGATAHGAHISLSFGTSGRITGQGIGMRATLHVPATATSFGGTVAAAQSEIYFDDTTATLANTTRHCIHRFILDGGDATARATCTTAFEFVNVSTGTSDATKMVNTANITASHGLNVIINGEAYCILLDKK